VESLIGYIRNLEEQGELDPDCKMCIEIFYSAILKGKTLTDIFAPRHKASARCRSGKHSHCTCDTCF
jgi:hypothetical protein